MALTLYKSGVLIDSLGNMIAAMSWVETRGTLPSLSAINYACKGDGETGPREA